LHKRTPYYEASPEAFDYGDPCRDKIVVHGTSAAKIFPVLENVTGNPRLQPVRRRAYRRQPEKSSNYPKTPLTRVFLSRRKASGESNPLEQSIESWFD
jgi:hypothetical protein